MNNKELEYKEMFMAEAMDNYEELNKLFIQLEKDNLDKNAINSIFRIIHTLKGNAMGLGFEKIADLSHVVEDIFTEIQNGNLKIDKDLFNSLYKANDKLGQLLEALTTEKRVSYKGIRTKLEVYLKKQKDEKVTEDEDGEDVEEERVDNGKIAFSDQVSIPVRKLDNLLNLVGELIIEKDSLVATSDSSSHFSRLHRITSDLQYGIMDVRLVQIGFMFNKFHRVLRDAATIEDKEVELKLEGTEIEIDRNILKIISDSMVHLVRNAVSHGIEGKADRVKTGKAETGIITLRARNEKDTVFIDVMDDGAGIDYKVIRKKAIEKKLLTEEHAQHLSEEEIIQYIFEPGFSNAVVITELSGRGVGMDVVKRATESVGGRIEIRTKVGEGSCITLSLPSSMAVKGALLFEMQKQEYAVPLSYTEAVISLQKDQIHKISDGLMSTYLDKTLSIIFLNDLYTERPNNKIDLQETFNQLMGNEKLDVLVVSYNGVYIGFVVDKLLQQKEIVEKTLSKPLDTVSLFSGATILGNGKVCLVIDVVNVLNSLFKQKRAE